MPYKHELEKRLIKKDYTRLPEILGLDKSYNQISDNDDYKKMLSIADKYGQKYLQFYKLKDNVDIDTVLSNLVSSEYCPNIPKTQSNICIAMLKKNETNKSFEIIANNYTVTKEWIDIEEGKRELKEIETRRVIYISYDNISKILIFSQDPVGSGAGISEKIPFFLKKIFEDNYNIDFNNYFELKPLVGPICDLIDDSIFTTNKIKGSDQSTGRLHETLGRNSKDNLKDDSIYQNIRKNDYNLERMRLKHKDFDSGTFEVFSQNILRIWFKINWDQKDVIKANITNVL